ncbi:MAG: 4-(cytidine 5'-diphospho)-2-C-methyl-D-erythritol kinase [Ruminococcaceae bacterium]|nr:4-(cytidine 5'-diphospho)-2-C-methyl-D-erythritol kinase [Oscillospiraceae bacterium]
MSSLTAKAYAKINLHLDVTGRLKNGYHTIRSVMQQVSLFDEITVTREDCPNGTREIGITCTVPDIPTDRRNIVYKCADAFFEHFGIDSFRISIHIDKRIPHGAGMAGGSTDGAAVLRLLPPLFGIDADADTLCRIGSRIGADIPFCIVGGSCLCEGIGEVLTPMKRRFDCPVLVAIDGEPVSTPEAYGMIDTMYGERFGNDSASAELAFMDSPHIPDSLYNIFESVILPHHPEASAIKAGMAAHGARVSLMSGSGPSVFGLFEDVGERDCALAYFTSRGVRAFPCEFVG